MKESNSAMFLIGCIVLAVAIFFSSLLSLIGVAMFGNSIESVGDAIRLGLADIRTGLNDCGWNIGIGLLHQFDSLETEDTDDTEDDEYYDDEYYNDGDYDTDGETDDSEPIENEN